MAVNDQPKKKAQKKTQAQKKGQKQKGQDDMQRISEVKGKRKKIALTRIDPLQTRAQKECDPEYVRKLIGDIERKEKLPLVCVVQAGDRFICVDGNHRIAAYLLLGYTEIYALVLPGTEEDALAYALSANIAHGKSLRVEDVRNKIILALKDPEIGRRGDAQIARQCGTYSSYVKAIREELEASGEIEHKDTTEYMRDGKKVTRKRSKTSRGKSGPLVVLKTAQESGHSTESIVAPSAEGSPLLLLTCTLFGDNTKEPKLVEAAIIPTQEAPEAEDSSPASGPLQESDATESSPTGQAAGRPGVLARWLQMIRLLIRMLLGRSDDRAAQ